MFANRINSGTVGATTMSQQAIELFGGIEAISNRLNSFLCQLLGQRSADQLFAIEVELNMPTNSIFKMLHAKSLEINGNQLQQLLFILKKSIDDILGPVDPIKEKGSLLRKEYEKAPDSTDRGIARGHRRTTTPRRLSFETHAKSLAFEELCFHLNEKYAGAQHTGRC